MCVLVSYVSVSPVSELFIRPLDILDHIVQQGRQVVYVYTATCFPELFGCFEVAFVFGAGVFSQWPNHALHDDDGWLLQFGWFLPHSLVRVIAADRELGSLSCLIFSAALRNRCARFMYSFFGNPASCGYFGDLVDALGTTLEYLANVSGFTAMAFRCGVIGIAGLHQNLNAKASKA